MGIEQRERYELGIVNSSHYRKDEEITQYQSKH
jgi:hypothetical protein